MDKGIAKLFFVQLGLVALFLLLIIMNIYIPLGGIIFPIGIVLFLQTKKKVEEGVLRKSLLINSLSLVVFPFFYFLVILLIFPRNSVLPVEAVEPGIFESLLSTSAKIFSLVGVVLIIGAYLITSIMVIVLYIKSRKAKASGKVGEKPLDTSP